MKPNPKIWIADKRPEYLKKRLWKKVKMGAPDECWPFLGGINKKTGYGRFWKNGAICGPHRVAWEVTYGLIPDGMLVLHKCDYRRCCNPFHLFLGTDKDNYDDMFNKNRHYVPRGEFHGMRRLLPDDVVQIRKAYVPTVGTRQLADKYGISETHVFRIICGETWASVPGPIHPRHVIGPRKAPRRELTSDEVDQIKQMGNSGTFTQVAIAKVFRINQSAISRILRGLAH